MITLKESVVIFLAIVIIGTVVSQVWMLGAGTPASTVWKTTKPVAMSLAVTGLLVAGLVNFV